jgi:phospholipase/carboxylesterase
VDTSQPPTFLAYAAHGISDVVIPVEKARATILPLSEKYTEIKYHEFPEGHSVSQENFTRLLGWLEKTEL